MIKRQQLNQKQTQPSAVGISTEQPCATTTCDSRGKDNVVVVRQKNDSRQRKQELYNNHKQKPQQQQQQPHDCMHKKNHQQNRHHYHGTVVDTTAPKGTTEIVHTTTTTPTSTMPALGTLASCANAGGRFKSQANTSSASNLMNSAQRRNGGRLDFTK